MPPMMQPALSASATAPGFRTSCRRTFFVSFGTRAKANVAAIDSLGELIRTKRRVLGALGQPDSQLWHVLKLKLKLIV